MDPIFNIGEFYKTRDGLTVQLIATNPYDPELPLIFVVADHSSDLHGWALHRTGTGVSIFGEESDIDILPTRTPGVTRDTERLERIAEMLDRPQISEVIRLVTHHSAPGNRADTLRAVLDAS